MIAFKIDGKEYPLLIVKSLKRSFQILDGPLVGRNMQGAMIRDIIGTYFNYTLELECSKLNVKQYDELYNIISSPKMDCHKITVPGINQGMIEFDAYITSGDDTLKIKGGSFQQWGNLSMKFIAMKPFISKG